MRLDATIQTAFSKSNFMIKGTSEALDDNAGYRANLALH